MGREARAEVRSPVAISPVCCRELCSQQLVLVSLGLLVVTLKELFDILAKLNVADKKTKALSISLSNCDVDT